MQSPSVPFITGANGIVGAQAVADGKAATAGGVKANGQKLTITLMKPDGSFLSKMAMDFFCPIPKGTPINADGINSFASFGPYYVASRQVGRQLIMRTNPNYKGSRPHNVGTFVFTMNTNLDQSLLQVKAGQSDYDAGGLPATAHASLAQQYGVHKGGNFRYFVNGGLNVDYIALNTSRNAFKSVGMRKAANYAIDRPAWCVSAARSPGAGTTRSFRPASPATRTSRRSRSRAPTTQGEVDGLTGQAAARTSPCTRPTAPSARTWRRCSSTTWARSVAT